MFFVGALGPQLADIRAAIDWAVVSGRTGDSLRLVGALWRFWWTGAKGDGLDAIRTPLGGEGGTSDARARALVAGALAASSRLDFAAAVDFGVEAVAAAEARVVQAFTHCWLGWALAVVGHPDAATHLERAVALSAEEGEMSIVADARNGVAYVAVRAGEAGRALAIASDVLAITDATGNKVTRCHALTTTAMARTMLGDLNATSADTAEAAGLANAVGDDVYHVLLLVLATRVAVLCGDQDTAATAARAAEAAATAARAAEAAATAARAAEAAAAASVLLMSCARAASGLAAYAAGDAATAASDWESAIAAVAVTDQATAVDLAVMLADAHRACGDPASETAAVELATTMAGSGTSRWERARALLGAARRHLHHGRPVDAATAAYEACTLGVELGDIRTQAFKSIEIDESEILRDHPSGIDRSVPV